MAKNENYKEFVEKFKPKKTSDDCYTPPLVYEAVKNWVVEEYNLQGREIVRPFYPGGDYENFDYPDNCIVIDNPPFSILAKIRRFYCDRGIKYFLFAPGLSLFSPPIGDNYIIADCTITYDNGARINTSFVNNLDTCFIRTAPALRSAIIEADKTARSGLFKTIPKYTYPSNVISSALLQKVATVDFTVNRDECSFIRALDSQKPVKKEIYGNGYLISDQKAAELKAAKEKAEELRAAELRAEKENTVWKLSVRERDIISRLST